MSENLDRIANVIISLENPVSSDASFDFILLVGAAPAVAPATAPPDVGVYSSALEVEDAGWVLTGDSADPIGAAARVAFSQDPKPSKIYIAVRKTVTTGKGDNATTTFEDVSATMSRALLTAGWWCVCPIGFSDDELKTLSEWTETQEKIMGYTTFSTADIMSNLKYRTFPIFGGVNTGDTAATVENPDNQYAAVALAAKTLGYQAGSETWANQVLNGITPAKLSSTVIETLEGHNISYIQKVGSTIVSKGGKVSAGEWIDVIRFRDWLKNDMQLRIANLLILNPKIPYTDNGIAAVENQMLASLQAGQRVGGIAPAEYDELDQEIPGYQTSVPLAANLTAAQRASRTLTDCKFRARLAGAIHVVNVNGSLTYQL